MVGHEMTLQATVVITAMLVTAYTPHDEGMNGLGIMANGHYVFEGAAACPPDWPFGVVFYLPELKRWGMCADRGSAIVAGRLDLFMHSRVAALEFGRQRLKVVLPWGEYWRRLGSSRRQRAWRGVKGGGAREAR